MKFVRILAYNEKRNFDEMRSSSIAYNEHRLNNN